MRVGITRIDPSLPLPAYASEGAIGFDFYCREHTIVEPGETARLPTNVVISVPEGHALVVTLRSSTPERRGLLIPNGIGVIDRDYRGPGDEVKILVYNFGHATVTIERGERIAQGIILPVAQVVWEERPSTGPSRGGFGSTGA